MSLKVNCCVFCHRVLNSSNLVYDTSNLEHLQQIFSCCQHHLPSDTFGKCSQLEFSEENTVYPLCSECLSSSEKLLELDNRLNILQNQLKDFIIQFTAQVKQQLLGNEINHQDRLPLEMENATETVTVVEVDLVEYNTLDNSTNSDSTPATNDEEPECDTYECYVVEEFEIDELQDAIEITNNQVEELPVVKYVSVNNARPESSESGTPSNSVPMDAVATEDCSINFENVGKSNCVSKTSTDEQNHITDIDSIEEAVNELNADEKNSQELSMNKEIFQCLVCQKCFSERTQLVEHTKVHKENRIGNLKLQPNPSKSLVHSKNNTFRSIEKRKARTEEIRAKSCMCDQCGNTFYDKYHLREHYRSHTGEKPYKCKICNETFQNYNKYKPHENFHNGIKFDCNVCDKSFYNKTAWAMHIKIHSVEKSHKCLVCDKGFTQKTNLDNHMTTHTGEKAHLCQRCGRAFSRKGSLERHYLWHQKEDNPENKSKTNVKEKRKRKAGKAQEELKLSDD